VRDAATYGITVAGGAAKRKAGRLDDERHSQEDAGTSTVSPQRYHAVGQTSVADAISASPRRRSDPAPAPRPPRRRGAGAPPSCTRSARAGPVPPAAGGW